MNRIVVHSSVHQPLLGKAPGLTLFIFGQTFNRNETWAGQARPWVDYSGPQLLHAPAGPVPGPTSRDFYGEEAPLTGLYGDSACRRCAGALRYDFVNADIVLNLLSVKDGWLTTPSGMRYRALQLGEVRRG